jgi:hypothetical protein
MKESTMKCLTLAAIVVLSATLAQAQVFGTYRPSVVTYYPTATSGIPAASQPQIAQASYYGTTPVTTPIAAQSYYAAPVTGCQCTPLQSYPTNITPTAYYSPTPVTYAQPVSYAAPIQTVSYNAQPALGPNRYIGRNLFGSPKVYANGQPVRNALRWLGP